MISIAVVDSGPLLAAANREDPYFEQCLRVLESPDLHLVIPALCVAEVAFVLGSRHGSRLEASFLAGLEAFDVQAPTGEDWSHIAHLVRKYEDFPLGGTDASVVALAERYGTDLIVTLDRRHFSVVRSRGGTAFRLLPDSKDLSKPGRR